MTKKIKVPSRFEHARRWLIFWTLFIGVGAVCGAAGMLIDPTGKAMGMDSMLPYFEKLPFSEILFQDYVFSGISLLIVNGISNLTAAALLFFRKKSGIILGGVFGVTLMLWICIQFYMFPFNFMSTIYFIFGAAQAATGYAAWIFKKQESFIVDSADYPDIGKNPARLVVFSLVLVMLSKRRLRKQTVPVQKYMKSNQQSAPKALLVFGGAAVSECIAGRCPLKIFQLTFLPLSILQSVRPYGYSVLQRPCGRFVPQPPEKSKARITYWFTTPADDMKMPLRKWTSCSKQSTPALRAISATQASSKK